MSTLRFTASVGVGSSGACCHMRATLALACAQAATLCTQVVGHTRSRRRKVGDATDIKPHLLGAGLCLGLHWMPLLTSDCICHSIGAQAREFAESSAIPAQ